MRRELKIPLTKRMRLFIVILAMLWLAVLLQFAVERIFFRRGSITEAFAALSMEENTGSMTITASYEAPYLSEYDKKQLLYYLAEKIGLKVTEEPVAVYGENRCEVRYEKQAERAATKLKVISISDGGTDAHYLYAELTIREETARSIAAYKKCLEAAIKELGAKELAVTLALSGEYAGELPLAKKDALTDKLLDSLGAKCVYENRENDNYTVYAYTGLLEEYITVEKKRINVQVAISYDETADRTKIYLATPMMAQ